MSKIGEIRLMNCGQSAKIIRYDDYYNIDVEFEDGYIASNKCYAHFKNGQIKSRLSEVNRMGEEKLMNCGLKAKIIKYVNAQDVDVEFEDGYIRKHQCYSHFKNGRLESKFIYENRVGEIKTMNDGVVATITKYNHAKDIDVAFNNSSTIFGTTYQQFKLGTLISPNSITVEGIGYLGDATVESKSRIRWVNMLKRCYNKELLTRNPTYKGCTVCEEWHNYSKFKKWHDENYYEIENQRMNLDKDILTKGNKIYSPETCVFVPQKINTLFVKTDSKRGDFPIGVRPNGKHGYMASYCRHSGINDNTKNNRNGTYLGTFKTPEEAFYTYKKAKEEYIKQIADEYKDMIPQKLYDAMYRYEVEITD